MAGLSADERSLLGEALSTRPDLEPLVQSLDAGELLSEGDADRLRSAVGDAIGRTGVEDGVINERGIRLDNLIDRIGQISGMWRA